MSDNESSIEWELPIDFIVNTGLCNTIEKSQHIILVANTMIYYGYKSGRYILF